MTSAAHLPEMFIGAESSIPWPPDDPNPVWRITGHWRRIDGRPRLIGIDVRSFTDAELGNPDTRRPVGADYAVIDHVLLRGLRATEIADGTLNGAIRQVLGTEGGSAVTRETYARQLVGLTKRGDVRMRAPAADDDLLAQVAALYTEALSTGGTVSGRPAKYVEDQLRAAGLDVAPERVRAWVARCRRRGMLAATTERHAG